MYDFFRFKLIIGQLQLDNQLPLSIMPVAFATESMPDSNHPVFKANIAVSNVASNGIQVYPHVYIRVIFVVCSFLTKKFIQYQLY
jgi:vacuolar protein sorting-associated protein 13A/C